MSIIIKWIGVIVFCLGISAPVRSQEVVTLKDTTEYATPPNEDFEEFLNNPDIENDTIAPPESLFFSKDTLDFLRKTKSYRYMSNLDSLLRDYQKKKETLEDPIEVPSKSIFDFGFVKLFLWGFALFAVIYILYQLFGNQKFIFSRKNKSIQVNSKVMEIKTFPDSFILLAQKSAETGDFRLAIRYYHRYILELMNEKQIIVWTPQKTNQDYLKEISQKPLYQDFATLTLQFEYVWFGDFYLNKTQYENIENGFRKYIETWL